MCLEGLEHLEGLQPLQWISLIGRFLCPERLRGLRSLVGLKGVEGLSVVIRGLVAFFDF